MLGIQIFTLKLTLNSVSIIDQIQNSSLEGNFCRAPGHFSLFETIDQIGHAQSPVLGLLANLYAGP
jgi:hypothetical protein